MKKLLVAVAIMTLQSAHASIIEDKEPGILEVLYMKTHVLDTLKMSSSSEQMTLRIGKTSAMFYPPKKMWADSLLQTDYASYEAIHRKANPIGQVGYNPIGGLEREFLFRNVSDGETMVYGRIGGDGWSYVEPTEAPVWEIKEDTKEILGYQCRLATCDYRGRKWNAWFTPEIPINEGPWKLFGLPGLVLEASDSKNHYSYQAIGISDTNIGPVGIRLYVRNPPFKLKSRQKYLQKYYKESIKGKFVATMSSMYGNGSQSKPVESQYDSQETDYPHE